MAAAGTLGTASLSLSPASQTLAVGSNLSLEIRLNTGGQAVTAVSGFLDFDAARLEFVSVDSSTSSFSVKAEEILSGGQVKISRGQATPGVNSASALVAKVNFKALSSGTAPVSFALTTPGSGPSRVIKNDGLGTDILGGVTNGSYTINAAGGSADTIAPSVSITAPAVNATVSATTTISATASDNVGVVGVQFKLDNVNLGSEDTSSPYDISWNTTQATNGTHALTAVARDAAGNTASSATVNINVANTATLTTAVTIADDLFTPKQLTVTAGTTVVWTNTGARSHTVTADNGSFDSGTLSPGATFSRQFNTPGTYPYYCIFHGGSGGVGQSGTIIVTSTASASATASLSLSPSTQTLKVNDSFTVDIRLNTGGQTVTAMASNLNFDNSKLQVLAVDSSSSAFGVTAEEVISSNVIKISRGQVVPGILSGNALVARITFKAMASGTANVNFSLTAPGSGPSRVIKNDGLGTDILGSVTNGSYTITAASTGGGGTGGGGGGSGGGGGVSTAPTRQGALIKYHNSPTVYLVENGLKRPIPSYEIYLAHYKARPIALIPDSQSYPTGSPVKFGPGALLKSRNNPTVYLVIDNSTKYGFRSAEEFHRFGYRFEQVREIAESELASYPDAGLASLAYHATGNFIKYPNNPTVYKIEHNTKRGIPSLAVFLSHADLSQILVVSTSFQYADGPILGFAEGILIKGSGPTVYLVQDQKRRGFRSAQSFLDLGYSFSQVRVVSDADLALHQEGEPF